MRPVIPALLLAVLLAVLPAVPTPAQTAAEPDDDSPSLFEKGAESILRGLIKELEPAMDDMADAFEKLRPALSDMARLIDDIGNYEAPRILPNGDILIPRRPGAPPSPLAPEEKPLAPGEIEL